jgi:hypothetical protein
MKRIRPARFIVFAALASIALFASVACAPDFLQYEKVRIELPETPPSLRAALAATGCGAASNGKKLSWTLSWHDENGERRCTTGLKEGTTIELERGTFTPVIAEPETEKLGLPHGAVPPAGALYPADCSVDCTGATDANAVTLELSWSEGVAASMAESICAHARGGFDDGRNIASHVNWRRFDEEAAKKDEPHRIDEKRFVEAALSGAITKWDVSMPDVVDLDFPRSLSGATAGSSTAATQPCPAAGETFCPEWPDGPSFLWPGAAGSLTVAVHEGVSRFFGERSYLTVSVEKGRILAAFFTPYSLQD